METAVSPGSQVLASNIAPLEEWASTLVIANAFEYETAANNLKQVKGVRSRVVEFFKDSKDKAYATWKSITSNEKAFTDRLDVVERQVKGAMVSWSNAEEEKRLSQERKLQVEANARAEAERKRLEAQAAKLKSPELKAARLEQAASVIAPVVTVQTEKPAVAGIATVKTWVVDKVDKRSLITAAVSDFNLQAYLLVDEAALKRIANATKGQMTVPGVTFRLETSMRASGK